MKRSLFLLIFLIFGLLAPDQASAQVAIEDCFKYIEKEDYLRAIEAGQDAVRLEPNNGRTHFCLGDAYSLFGEPEYALSEMEVAERLTPSKDTMELVYNRMGLIYGRMGDYDNALLYNNKYLSLARELGDKIGEGNALYNLAMIYNKNDEPDKALGYYEELLRVVDEKERAPIYNTIASTYNKKGDYQKAIESLKKAIEIGERHGLYQGVPWYMLNLGDTYRMAKDFALAEEYLAEGLKRILKAGNKYQEATAYKHFGWLYVNKEDLLTARDYFGKAYTLFTTLGVRAEVEEIIAILETLPIKPGAPPGS